MRKMIDMLGIGKWDFRIDRRLFGEAHEAGAGSICRS